MDGYTLLQQWKTDDRLKSIPFIVYTATYTDPKDEQLALSLGADAFILKPAEPADLIARINQIIAATESGKTTAIRTPTPDTVARIPIAAPDEEDARNLRQYSEVLIHKLEDKMEELDKANRELQREIAERKRTEEQLKASLQEIGDLSQERGRLSQRLLTVHEDERSRLARELHDDVTQRLARLAIDAAQAEGGVPTTPDSGTWRRMREELVRLSEDVHSLAYRLHPSILDELGLVTALQAECDSFSRRESIPADFKSRDVPRELSRDVALCLFRIAQGSLLNVARHAHANAVEISLARMEGGLQLSVHDNGVGFNPAEGHGHASLGLLSMKERALAVKGELDVETEPGLGTTIVAWVPLEVALKS
jgi:signal transduction histidine kinase